MSLKIVLVSKVLSYENAWKYSKPPYYPNLLYNLKGYPNL